MISIDYPYRAPSDEWKDKIDKAESELQKERELRLGKERENSRYDIIKKKKHSIHDKTFDHF